MRENSMAESRTAPFDGPEWNPDIVRELASSEFNGRVGSQLVSETERVRIWHLELAPGQRIGFHRHVNDYFWTVLTSGRAMSRHSDGRVIITDYKPGDTRHYRFGPSEFMLHDLENIGDTPLQFVTVEHLGGANVPLRI